MSGASPVQLLPYGPHFRWVDEIIDADGASIRTRKCYAADVLVLQSHFEHGPWIVPGVLLIEQVAQSACLAGLLPAHGKAGVDAGAAGAQFVLGQVKARFHARAHVPCSVLAEVDLRMGRRTIGFRGRLSIDGALIAEVSGMAMRAPR